MLTVLKENRASTEQIFIEKNNEDFQQKPFKNIYVSKTEKIEEAQKDGSILIKFKKTKTNVTKKVNETAKMLKVNTAQSKIEELKELLNKGE